MSDPLTGELGRDQLRELISILGELRNAGPRDQRFKQWRQVTVTLLQRMWAGYPERAERFRRIPFSAPTMRADRKATREYYERGCSEAVAYLESLASELTPGGPVGRAAPASSRMNLRPPEPFQPEASSTASHPAPPPPGPRVTPSPQNREASPGPIRRPPEPDPPQVGLAGEHVGSSRSPVPLEVPEFEEPESERSVMGPRARLKDMLGFGDEAVTGPTSPQAPPPPTPPPAPAAKPTRGPAPAPGPARASASREPTTGVQRSPEHAPLQGSDPRRDLAAEFVLESTVLQSRARPLSRTELASTTASAASEARGLATQLEDLGVPLRHQAVLRAALVDLGRQMESPPVYWDSIRQAVALVMDHPHLARRVLPLLMPYLDQAA